MLVEIAVGIVVIVEFELNYVYINMNENILNILGILAIILSYVAIILYLSLHRFHSLYCVLLEQFILLINNCLVYSALLLLLLFIS